MLLQYLVDLDGLVQPLSEFLLGLLCLRFHHVPDEDHMRRGLVEFPHLAFMALGREGRVELGGAMQLNLLGLAARVCGLGLEGQGLMLVQGSL